MNTNVRVLFFGAAREIAGASEIDFVLPNNTKSAEAFETILGAFPALRERFGKSLLFAVNQNYADGEETIRHNDELAVFPPVSGG